MLIIDKTYLHSCYANEDAIMHVIFCSSKIVENCLRIFVSLECDHHRVIQYSPTGKNEQSNNTERRYELWSVKFSVCVHYLVAWSQSWTHQWIHNGNRRFIVFSRGLIATDEAQGLTEFVQPQWLKMVIYWSSVQLACHSGCPMVRFQTYYRSDSLLCACNPRECMYDSTIYSGSAVKYRADFTGERVDLWRSIQALMKV